MAPAPDRATDQIVAIDLPTTRSSALRGAARSATIPGRCGGLWLPALLNRPILLRAVFSLHGVGRLGSLLLALIVVVQQIAVAAHDLGALLAIRFEATVANQRANTGRLGFHRI